MARISIHNEVRDCKKNGPRLQPLDWRRPTTEKQHSQGAKHDTISVTEAFTEQVNMLF